jgi:multimeric flavodoxin WrbA
MSQGGNTMHVIAINGSPRKKWNTAMLLEKALEGAASQGAGIELIHLYDMSFKGCISCFACKTKDGPSYGRCGVKDALTPVLQKVTEADALILGSPIYFGTATGEMRSFMERLLFPFMTYTDPPGSLLTKKIRTGFIYTLNAPEEISRQRGFDGHMMHNDGIMKMVFGNSEWLTSYDTYQFADYSKMVAPRFNPEKKTKRRAEVFPDDCQKAFALGVRLAAKG